MGEDVLSGQVCGNCGKPLYVDDKYCGECGAEVPRCINCGMILPSKAKFCHNCGYSAAKACPNCKKQLPDNLPEGTIFCPFCGDSLVCDRSPATSSSAPSKPNHAPVSSASVILSQGTLLPISYNSEPTTVAPASVSVEPGTFVSDSPFKASLKAWGLSSDYAANDAQSVSVAPALDYLPKAGPSVGEYVKFGHYNHKAQGVFSNLFGSDKNKDEPIEWLVLENDGKTALLVSRYGLDSRSFHGNFKAVTWRDCDLRKWLNGEFFNRAFNEAEQRQIAESRIYTLDNPFFGIKGCGETCDWVFCLSFEEAIKYFANDNARQCEPTCYAVGRKAYKSVMNTCVYWTRSPGEHADFAVVVDIRGTLFTHGYRVNMECNAVRPALRIIL